MKNSKLIPHHQPDVNTTSWQSQLGDVITSGTELLSELGLENSTEFSELASSDFPLKVPRSFVRRMEPGNPHDPLLRQVLSSQRELLVEPGYSKDPVGETGGAITAPGIIQKYQSRVLLILSSGCAVNCRYCFRRHFPYSDNQNSRHDWQEAIASIAKDPKINEVILSGGDPLLVGDTQLAALVQQIAKLPHVHRLRIHTRLPVVIPQRITPALLSALRDDALNTIMVIHSNHANEIDSEVAMAMAMAKGSGITLLNQAVLLKGINDSATALTDLSEALFTAGVLPYYLHLLDKVQGAAHFDVTQERGKQLIAKIQAHLPGFLVPRLVLEEAGATSKTILA